MKRTIFGVFIALATSYSYFLYNAHAEPVTYNIPGYEYSASSWTVAGTSFVFVGAAIGYRLSVQGGNAEFKLSVDGGAEGNSIFVKQGEPIERSLGHLSRSLTIKLQSLDAGATAYPFADGNN